MKNTILILGFLAIFNFVHSQTMGTMTDSRDNKSYNTITFDDESSGTSVTWMSQNLNYKTPESYVHPENDSLIKDIGLLYTWEGAIKACPEEWHLASDDEWNNLIDQFGGFNTAAEFLKSEEGWNASGNGNNSSGFNVFPASFRGTNGLFSFTGGGADFWTASSSNEHKAWRYYFYYGYTKVNRIEKNKDYAFSCRCVMN
ncbi:MAG: hypothetical protein L3J34_11855 [Flavobacteriaceae bacterium]|nr:hypothetical protein [Flavobacteriaceae bacterium]